jgi:hypothetical protein
MQEKIAVNGTAIRYYEYGLDDDDAEELQMEIEDDAVAYIVETGYIPMEKLEDGDGDSVDFEYRGKMILFGEEYYVKEIKGDDEIYLARGAVVEDVTSEGFTT